MTFEQSMRRLEEITRKLEQGEVSLDETVQFFEEGMTLYRECLAKLTETEKKIELLTRDQEGNLTRTPFDAEKSE